MPVVKTIKSVRKIVEESFEPDPQLCTMADIEEPTMAKRQRPLDMPNTDFEREPDDEIKNAWAVQTPQLGFPAHKQTQDRLIKLEVDLVGGLVALADEIETGSSAPPKALPALPHMSLADFNKALPSRLTALQEDLERQINRIRSLLF